MQLGTAPVAHLFCHPVQVSQYIVVIVAPSTKSSDHVPNDVVQCEVTGPKPCKERPVAKENLVSAGVRAFQLENPVLQDTERRGIRYVVVRLEDEFNGAERLEMGPAGNVVAKTSLDAGPAHLFPIPLAVEVVLIVFDHEDPSGTVAPLTLVPRYSPSAARTANDDAIGSTPAVTSTRPLRHKRSFTR
jgi:hypothetical protein